MSISKILIVDDEAFNVDYLEQELEELAYETLTASNGQEALDRVRSDSPDLVLLDIMMPVMDGFTALAQLKANPDTRDIPVIVISASNDLKSVVRGIQLGAEDYLPKPFEPALLKARISSSLEKKHLRDLEQIYLKSMERELEIGREIQQGFLPAELPEVGGWEIAVYLKAAREVAGDFYDVFNLPDGCVLFVIGDVCDKGVGAALFMALFRSLIRVTATSDLSPDNREVVLQPEERLKHIISFTNTYFEQTHGDAGMFATILIGIIDPHNGRCIYMNCGHEPALWVRKDRTITPLYRTGPLVGIIPEATFNTAEIVLENGDLVLAFTDGIPDAINKEEEPFGKERLLHILETAEFAPARLIQEVEGRIHDFTGDARQFDDITMLAFRRNTLG